MSDQQSCHLTRVTFREEVFYFNIWHIWLEKAYIHAPKTVFWQFGRLNGLQYQPKPKSTPLRESASFEPSSVKM